MCRVLGIAQYWLLVCALSGYEINRLLYIAGIWAGMHTVRYFDGKTYEWVGISRQPNIMGKVMFGSVLSISQSTLCSRFNADDIYVLNYYYFF